ncbi:MAG TPA: SAM-dependent methyltransferase, partial [Mycobacteriales bacterium]|nr:SAM-dependent methyltransferase [Mycobacteriales bacterium]
FMVRAAHYLAAELGIRQFLDIGTGLPTSPNLHEVVQKVAPESRVVYVDNDPIVLVHARALLTSTPQGRTAYIDADLRDTEAILSAPQLRGTLDFDRPIALCLLAILHFLTDEAEVHRIVDRLVRPLARGSVLAIATLTADSEPEEIPRGVAAQRANGIPVVTRNSAQVEALFTGVDLIDPGVVLVHRWRADPSTRALDDMHVHMYGGLGIKR